jgi:hypothetical protein
VHRIRSSLAQPSGPSMSARLHSLWVIQFQIKPVRQPLLHCGGDLRQSHPSQICIPTRNALDVEIGCRGRACGDRRRLETRPDKEAVVNHENNADAGDKKKRNKKDTKTKAKANPHF